MSIDLRSVRDLVQAVAGELSRLAFPGAAMTAPADYRTCAVPNCHRRATEGLLCDYGPVGKHDDDGGHLGELARWLHEIQEEAERLDARPSMSVRWGSAGGSSLASLRAPAVLDVLVHTDPRSTAHGWQHIGPVCAACSHRSCALIRADADEHDAQAERPLYVLGVLNDLAQRVRDERKLGPPVRPIVVPVPPGYEGPYFVERDGTIGATTLIPGPPTIKSERKVLSKQLRWIAAQDWVLDMREDLAELRAQLQRATGNVDDQPLTGYCYKLVDDQGTECHGNLWPVFNAHSAGYEDDAEEDGPARPREVVCDRNPTHRWKGGRGGDLARLALILEAQQKRDAAEHPAPAARRLHAVPRVDDGLTPADRLALVPRAKDGLTVGDGGQP